MLTESDVKEQISYAYLHALAARAGLSCERPHVDRDSVDAEVCAKGFLAPDSDLGSPKVGFQLKATSAKLEEGTEFSFRLKVKNYNDLRRRNMVPRLLAVLVMPETAVDWITHDEKGLITRHCAYWLNLLGQPEATQETLVPIKVSRANLLTPAALMRFCMMASKREDFPRAL